MGKPTGSWICRDYNSGDEYNILDLFNKVFGRDLSLQTWKWRFMESPLGKGIIKLLFDNEKLIGHYAVVPMDVQVSGKVVNAVFSMTTMTHPDYRGRGIFVTLAKETYSEALQKGAAFVYGFPNSNSYRGFTEKLGWTGFGNMAIWQKISTAKDVQTLRVSSHIRQVRHFDDRITSLWEKVKHNYTVIVPRTRPFLNWRFVQNPDVNYTNYVFEDDKGQTLGYIVLKIYRSKIEHNGHIIDMLSVNDMEVVRQLLICGYKFFADQGVPNISCFCPDNCLFSEALKADGFAKGMLEKTFSGVMPLTGIDDSLDIIRVSLPGI
jgi:predicted acetyltransferase